MRRTSAVVALSCFIGCVSERETPRRIDSIEPCAGVLADNGDGTTTVACSDGTRDLVCTRKDCDGVTTLTLTGGGVTRVLLPSLSRIESLNLAEIPELTTVSLPSLTYAGDLQLAGDPALTSVDLRALASVERWLGICGNPSLAALRLPSLSETGHMQVCGAALTLVDLRSLSKAVDVSISGTALTTLGLPALASVGMLEVVGNGALSALSLPALSEVTRRRACSEMGCWGGVYISGNGGLGLIDLPVLASAGSVEVSRERALEDLYVPALTTLRDGSGSGRRWGSPHSLQVTDNAALRRISFPALTLADGIDLSRNPALSRLELPRLEEAADAVSITSNAALSSCEALGLVARLRASGFAGTALVAGNDEREACPPGPVCPATLVERAEDWERLALRSCEEIAGDLVIRGAALAAVPAAPALAFIDGDLVVSENPALVEANFPVLATVHGAVELDRNPVLRGVGLTGLAQAQSVTVASNPGLLAVELPLLTGSWGLLVVEDNDALEVVSAAGFHDGDLRIAGNRSLTSLSMPGLETTWGVEVSRNAALARLGLPALWLVQELRIFDNSSLAELALPALTDVRILFEVRSNPELPQCQVARVFGGLVNFRGNSLVGGNDLTAPCP